MIAGLLEVVATNALCATVVAFLVALITRYVRRIQFDKRLPVLERPRCPTAEQDRKGQGMMGKRVEDREFDISLIFLFISLTFVFPLLFDRSRA